MKHGIKEQYHLNSNLEFTHVNTYNNTINNQDFGPKLQLKLIPEDTIQKNVKRQKKQYYNISLKTVTGSLNGEAV